jgi:hypothetical protein
MLEIVVPKSVEFTGEGRFSGRGRSAPICGLFPA